MFQALWGQNEPLHCSLRCVIGMLFVTVNVGVLMNCLSMNRLDHMRCIHGLEVIVNTFALC